jgi:hypothetical protein
MVAALVVAIGMGVQNGFHVSWGTGYASSEYASRILRDTDDH